MPATLQRLAQDVANGLLIVDDEHEGHQAPGRSKVVTGADTAGF
jgi:hypothetical protein